MSDDTQAIINSAVASTEADVIDLTDVADIDKIRTYIVPEGFQVKSTDFENLRETPRRKKGWITVWDAPSFAKYVNEHKNEATTLFMSDEGAYDIKAILNGNKADQAGWGDHVARLAMRQTDEWRRWLLQDGKMLPQETFAEHIERNIDDVVEPDGATLLEIAQTFQATTKAEFRSVKRIANGQVQFTYAEDIDASAGNGELTIPATITLGIAPFEGASVLEKVTLRFRYRIERGRVTLGYVIHNPKDVEKKAFKDVVEDVAEATAMQPLYGFAEY